MLAIMLTHSRLYHNKILVKQSRFNNNRKVSLLGHNLNWVVNISKMLENRQYIWVMCMNRVNNKFLGQ